MLGFLYGECWSGEEVVMNMVIIRVDVELFAVFYGARAMRYMKSC